MRLKALRPASVNCNGRVPCTMSSHPKDFSSPAIALERLDGSTCSTREATESDPVLAKTVK